MLQFVIACGVIAVLYGIFASRSILAASAGTERMQEIAGAIQEGAKACLDRQYRTIGIAGIVVAVILFFTLGSQAAIGFLIGAVLSGAAGYVRVKRADAPGLPSARLRGASQSYEGEKGQC